MAPNQKDKPGYEGYLNDNVVTISQLLKDNGYHTYMTGKWHLAYGAFNPTEDWDNGQNILLMLEDFEVLHLFYPYNTCD